MLERTRGIEEKKMFDVCFLLDSNLLVGVWKDSLIARRGPDEAEAALREPHVRPFDITSRPMRNWVLVESEGGDPPCCARRRGDDQLPDTRRPAEWHPRLLRRLEVAHRPLPADLR